jgi:hypothetical protein
VLGVLTGTARAEVYAVMIQGSSPRDGLFEEGKGIPPIYDSYMFMDEFWNDDGLLHQDWLRAGIPEENIWVLWGDGSQWGMEQPGYQPRYRIPFVDMDCSRESLDSICAYLTGVLTENDILLVHTFDHGGKNTLSLYGSMIFAEEFAELFDTIPYKYRVFLMQQCNSGSFIDELQNEKTILATSTDSTHSAYRADDIETPGDTMARGIENEIYQEQKYNHGEWNFHLLTAFSGGWKPTADSTKRLLDLIDTNKDWNISLAEAHNWILTRDTRYAANREFPQLSDLGNLADSFYIWPEIYCGKARPRRPMQKTVLYVYPNPTRSPVSFKIREPFGQTQLKIFDSSGRLVKRAQIITRVEVKLDITGVYFYKLYFENEEIQSGKLVVLK